MAFLFLGASEIWSMFITTIAQRSMHGPVPTPAVMSFQSLRISSDVYAVVVGILVPVFRSSKLWPGLRLLIAGSLLITFHLIPLFFPYRYIGYDNILDFDPRAVSNLLVGVILFGLVTEIGFGYLLLLTARRWRCGARSTGLSEINPPPGT